MPKSLGRKIAIYAVLTFFTLVIALPLIIVLSSSFRTPSNMQSHLRLFTEINLESYRIAFNTMNFPIKFLNSIITTGGSIFVIVVIGTMVAYPISRIKNKFMRWLYYFFVAGLVIPAQMVIVPVTQMFNALNIPETRFTPMIMFITCSLPFSTFIYTGFLKKIPVELEEAAYIDGANLWIRLKDIVFPLLKPAHVAVIITQGLWIWNDYFFPMIFLTKSKFYTLPLGMIQFLGSKDNPAQWNILFAACILVVLPLIVAFSLMQKKFISGITAGSVKG
jgi:raffinose/stachyose/melibiose transport system permease protein